MKKLLVGFLMVMVMVGVGGVASASSLNPIASLNKDTVKVDCKKDLLKEWGSNFNLIKTLLDADMEAYDYLASQPSNDVSNKVMTNLLHTWYPHMYLIKTLYDTDMNAYKQLQ